MLRQLCFYFYASDHAPCDPVLGMDGIIESEFQARDVTIAIKEARKKDKVNQTKILPESGHKKTVREQVQKPSSTYKGIETMEADTQTNFKKIHTMLILKKENPHL